jgi:hypothetical protein
LNTNSPKPRAFTVYKWFAVLTDVVIVIYCETKMIRDSVVGIATGYELDGRVPVG